MNKVIIYIHGKGGSSEEAEHYKSLFHDCDAIGFDYVAQSPWEAKEEFPRFFDSVCPNYESVKKITKRINKVMNEKTEDESSSTDKNDTIE